MLPNDFPPYQTVYYWFRRLVRRFLFRTIHDLALMLDRMCEQREVVPSAGIVDSQSVKAPGAHERGYDVHKKSSGRKRHIAVDTDGRLLAVNLTPDDVADSTGVQLVLEALVKRWPCVKHLFGDAAYDRRTLLDKAAYLDFTVEVVRGLQGQSGFQVQPRRWVVERTFAWLMRYRRLVRDYEQRLDVSEAMMHIALGSSLMYRIHSGKFFKPSLSDGNVQSFHKLVADEIRGPARLFRIVSPNSRAMSDCWISEKVFNDIQNSPNPREAWRRFLAVWPDWNADGQFVIYDLKPVESLKAWRGPASGQTKDALPGQHLEGGYEQIVFNIARADPRNDVMRFYKLKGGKKDILRAPISQADFNKLTRDQQKEYVSIRESITHPNISGPFETGWGYTDFEGAGFGEK